MNEHYTLALRPHPTPQRWLQRSRTVCTTLLVCFFLIASASPQSAFTSFDVEAAYLYNFGKFVHWPPDAGGAASPFSICIVGEDPFGEKLKALVTNESIQGHPALMRRVATAAATENCQIVFLGASEESRLAKDLADLQKKPALTVSNLPNFLTRGGMVQFLQINNKVRFAVNRTAAEQTGLTFSSDLLKVAVTVDSNPAKEGRP